MADSISIVYPTASAPSNFLAWGVVIDPTQVQRQKVHVILYPHGSPKQSHKAQTLPSNPPLWGAVFSGIPEGKDYVLEVWDKEGGTKLKSITQLKIGNNYDLTTQSPASGSTISTGFYAWGTATNNYNVSGSMTIGTTVFNGATQYQPSSGDGYIWAIQFNVDSGSPYVLKVWNTNGENAPNVTGLIVS